MDEQKYNQYLHILEIDTNASLAEIKIAYERLKKIYSSDSIVMEAIDDEFLDEDKQKILTDIHEAYSWLFHYLVEKDRIEKENFEKEKTAKEIFDIQDLETFAEELHETDTPLFIEEEPNEEKEEIIEEADEIAASEERNDTWIPSSIPEPLELPEPPEHPEPLELPEHPELPEPLELPDIPELTEFPVDLGEPEDSDIHTQSPEALKSMETIYMPILSTIQDLGDTQELVHPHEPLELPEYIFPDPQYRENIPPQENSRSPYSTMIRVTDPSATNPMEDPLLDPNLENAETEGTSFIKGRTFKKYRERMGLGIHELAKASNISYKILVNLELERFEDLPEPGYLRWCVSTYAKALGMESPSIADEYMKRYRKWKQQQDPQ